MCLLKNFITFEAARYKISSNINEVIRSVLNFFFFFFFKKRFYKKAQNRLQRTKIKNVTYKGKKVTCSLIYVCAFAWLCFYGFSAFSAFNTFSACKIFV